ncbi:MAG: LysE family transporter [Desulfovibrionaceae bacterium]|nr:LysE family transporter [Desulfovibrionaceae bacterium]
MDYFLQGLSMGLTYVAPIGIQNLFVINTALERDKLHAWCTSGIVIFFDISLALACYFGIGLLMQQWPELKLALLLLGGLLIAHMGIQRLRAPVPTHLRGARQRTLLQTASMACAVAWLNPQAILDGTMMLGAFRAALPPEGGLHFLGGVCMASCLWFCGLTAAVQLGHAWISQRVLLRINQCCAVVMLLYAIRLLWNFTQAVAA